ncbi:MAG: methionyl-tRNA formyltransferase [Phycisphaeraceae bacterium]|nr:methionyl-tRNA formyltransferase [Phycisphaeraceae bacterium]
MRLMYFGSGAFGLPTLESLAARHEILGVVTQPDRPAGRGGKPTPTPIAEWAARNLPGVPLIKPERVNEASVAARIRDIGVAADAWVVIAFGQKLGRALLEGVMAVNLHASLLPRWRGAAPINAAILAGDAETGNSVITLAERMDAGLVLGQTRRSIEPSMTAGELHDLLAADGPALVQSVLERAVPRFRAGLEPEGEVQDNSRVTLANKLSKRDGSMRFDLPADFCRRQVHALTPWPGVTVLCEGRLLKVLRVRTVGGTSPQAPGALIDPAGGVVACGDGTMLALLEVQPPGKRPMAWADYARGRTLNAGDRFSEFEPGGHD